MTDMLRHLSTCKRAHCSAIIISPDFSCIHSIGYNGPPKGVENNACTATEGMCGCIHAEANAIIKLRYQGFQKLVMISNTAPCFTCAGLIINCGVIDQVIWKFSYRNPDGVNRLDTAHIKCDSLLNLGVQNVSSYLAQKAIESSS